MQDDGSDAILTKKERIQLEREQRSSRRTSAASRRWTSFPDVLFVIDPKKEAIAVRRRSKLGIPVVAIIDTNCDPDDDRLT